MKNASVVIYVGLERVQVHVYSVTDGLKDNSSIFRPDGYEVHKVLDLVHRLPQTAAMAATLSLLPFYMECSMYGLCLLGCICRSQNTLNRKVSAYVSLRQV